jgi:hypothetical protein
MRRKYEMQGKKHRDFDYVDVGDEALDTFQTMMKRTALQPNFRKYRSMRTVHGMDYIYQLRGMTWVRFKELGGVLRDWSFQADISLVTTMEKSQQMKLLSELGNLKSLFNEESTWQPCDLDCELVKSFYDQIVDDMPIGGSDTTQSDADSESEAGSGSSDGSSLNCDSGSDSGGPYQGGGGLDDFPDEHESTVVDDNEANNMNLDGICFPDEEDTMDEANQFYLNGINFPDENEEEDQDDEMYAADDFDSHLDHYPFPDDMDYDSGVDMETSEFDRSGDPGRESNNGHSGASSDYGSDGFDHDHRGQGSTNPVTQATSANGLFPSGQIHPHAFDNQRVVSGSSISSGHFVHQDRHTSEKASNTGNRSSGIRGQSPVDQSATNHAQHHMDYNNYASRLGGRAFSSGSDNMGPPRIIIDITGDSDADDRSSPPTTNTESLFVHSETGSSRATGSHAGPSGAGNSRSGPPTIKTESSSGEDRPWRNIVDLTGEDDDIKPNPRELYQQDEEEVKIKVKPDEDNKDSINENQAVSAESQAASEESAGASSDTAREKGANGNTGQENGSGESYEMSGQQNGAENIGAPKRPREDDTLSESAAQKRPRISPFDDEDIHSPKTV